MNITEPNQLSINSADDQLIVVLSNSKYTYANFSEFHETVLDLLSNNDLFNLSSVQIKNNQFFINIILSLLDAPKKNAISLVKKRGYQKSPSQHQCLSEESAVNINHSTQLNPDLSFKEDYNKLLNWIGHIVLLKRITIEQMLDEFYSLGISGLKTIQH